MDIVPCEVALNTEQRTDLRNNIRVMAVGNTIVTSANSLWIMFMPLWFKALALSVGFDDTIANSVVLVIFSIAALVRAFTMQAGGIIADKIGRKPVILIGFLIFTFGVTALFLLTQVNSLTPLSFLVLGSIIYTIIWSGGGFSRPASSMLLAESVSEKRKGLSYMFASRVLPSIPPALLIFIGGTLYVSDFSLALFLGLFGPLAVVVIFAFSLSDSTKDSISIRESSPVTHRSIAIPVLLLVLAFALDSVSSSGLSNYVPVFLDSKFGVEAVAIWTWMISVSTLVIAIAAVFAGIIVDHLGTKAALTLGWITLSITILVFPYVEDVLLIVIVYAMWKGLDMMDISIPALTVSEYYPQNERAQILGSIEMSNTLAGVVGPLLISGVLWLGPNVPFSLKVIMNILGVIAFLFAVRRLEDTDTGEPLFEN